MAMELVPVNYIRLVIFCVLPLLALCSCYSFAVVPMELIACSKNKTHQVRVWVSDQGLMDDYHWSAQAAFAILLYPLNVVGGIARGVSAPFDSGYDIEYGPVGFVVGVVVPGFTVMPRLMRSDPWQLTVSEEEAELLSKVEAFDVKAVMKILNRSPFVRKERVIFVEIAGQRQPVQY
jgi:hypothetical protein